MSWPLPGLFARVLQFAQRRIYLLLFLQLLIALFMAVYLRPRSDWDDVYVPAGARLLAGQGFRRKSSPSWRLLNKLLSY